MHISCDQPRRIGFTASLDSLLHSESFTVAEDSIALRGRAPDHVEPNYVQDKKETFVYDSEPNAKAMRFEAQIKVVTDGGKVPRAGLHADRSAAQAASERYRLGRGAGGYDPPETAQNRRHRPGQRAPHAATAQFRLSLARPVHTRLPRLALLNSAQLTENSTSTCAELIARQNHAQLTRRNMKITTPLA